MSADERAAEARQVKGRRRARAAAAQINGPVPAEVYAAILAEGVCVYCAAPATHVDHVRPLSRGGWEHEDNLVPACAWCNLSKGALLLTEWLPDRVEHAASVSPKVAAEYRQLTDGGAIMGSGGAWFRAPGQLG